MADRTVMKWSPPLVIVRLYGGLALVIVEYLALQHVVTAWGVGIGVGAAYLALVDVVSALVGYYDEGAPFMNGRGK